MHAGKALLIVLVVGLVVASGVFWFFPDTRPGFVDTWILKLQGFSPATSPEDALDKFKLAIEKRNYRAAKLYVTADYKEWLDKSGKDAGDLGKAIDDLKYAMNKHGVKSDKAYFILFALDPLPAGLKIKDVKTKDDE